MPVNIEAIRKMGKDIQKIAREVKDRHPDMKHKNAIKEAGRIYKKRRSKK